jgi:predicted dithiol-disulfide oxidoreductase (DUF899 family)
MRWYDFPGEDAAYRQAREVLLAEEIALRDQIERVAALRRALPPGKIVPDYLFREGPADLRRADPAEFRDVRLSALFADGQDTLIVDHLMYGAGGHLDFFGQGADLPCPMCSMWADGYNAIAPHVAQRAAFVLVATAALGLLRAWALSRGWDRIRLLSCRDNTFNFDLGIAATTDPDDAGDPGISVFTRAADGTIRHRYTIGADLAAGSGRGIDLLSPVWNLLDLTPAGRGDWYPGHHYLGAGAETCGHADDHA